MARFPSVGEDFGPYRIDRQLGRGGMGVVFAATHLGLGRTVALKVLSPELAGQADYRERFSREAAVLARLDSPHVVQVLDHGEHDGCLYIATQYVAGGDLAAALRQYGPVPLAQSAQVAEQVAGALADSHAAGVIHRDVKPSNVLLREISTEVFVYLCDFGIAQDRNPGLTAPGSVAGTFAYLAPERLRGEAATASSDLYALGCVLFTSLIGSAPYAGSDVEIGMSHLNAPVPQLVESSAVAARVNAVLRRSMAKDPGARYPDARAMRDDLRELVRLAQSDPGAVLTAQTPLASGGEQPAPVPTPPTAPAPPLAPTMPPGQYGGYRHPQVPQVPPAPQGPPPPPGSWTPAPAGPAWGGPPAPRRRRTGLVVGGVIAAVLAIVVGVGLGIVVTRGGDDDELRGVSTSGSSDPTSAPTSDETTEPTSDPTSDPTSEPTTDPTPTPPPTSPTVPVPDPPSKPKPTPTYPDVPAATGLPLDLGAASLRAPAGWGRIDPGIVVQGVGARDYSDTEGYYSSVFLRRADPGFRLDSVPVLKVAAQTYVESHPDSLTLEDSKLLPTAWLDGTRAVRIRALYYSKSDNLFFSEETWFAQRGRFLYRVTFQHSKADTLQARRAQIDPVIVSFRWR